MTDDGKHLRGFAAMDPEKRRRISREGGRAVHEYGTGHEFTSDEARAAGQKGGRAVHAKRRAEQLLVEMAPPPPPRPEPEPKKRKRKKKETRR
jgi:general stress protein YciG